MNRFAFERKQLIFLCQNNPYVEYKVQINDEENLFKDNDFLRDIFLKAIKNDSKVNFGLLINSNSSKFYNLSSLNSEDSFDEEKIVLSFSNYSGIVFNYNDSIFKQSSLLGKNIYSKEPSKKNWELHNDTKLIDNYLCYKATTIYKVSNGDKIFNHPVIAWYCPALPYKFGPNGYGNLPGLILELQVRNVLFGITKIDLKTDIELDLSSLKKAKILTEEELEKKLIEFNNFVDK